VTNVERMTAIAIELMKLHVSQAGITQLFNLGDLDEIERQLIFLPYRKAKRPGAFLIEAVRHRYSPPKEFTYAKHITPVSTSRDGVDEDPELAFGPSAPDPFEP
jgi:hypothetical protein